MGNIDFNLLLIFCRVAQLGSITKASESLFITQPAVTQAINRLESGLGVKLFIRQNKGVLLTDYGKLIYADVESGINLINGAIAKIEHLAKNENAVLKIGCGANIANWIVNKACKDLINKYPTIKIEIIDLKTGELVEKLKNGEIDCFISSSTSLNDINIISDRIKGSSFCFIGGEKFKYLSQGSHILTELNGLPFIVTNPLVSYTGKYFKEVCDKENLKIDVKVEASRFVNLIEFAKINLGVTFVPEYIANEVCDGKVLYKLKIDYNLKNIDYEIYYNKKYQSNLLIELLKDLKDAFKIDIYD